MSTPEDAFKKKLLAAQQEKDELVRKNQIDAERKKQIIAEKISFYQKHQNDFIQQVIEWASSADLNISSLNISYYDYGHLFQTTGISIEYDGKKVQFIPQGVERGTFLGIIKLDFTNANSFNTISVCLPIKMKPNHIGLLFNMILKTLVLGRKTQSACQKSYSLK
ncbi:TPA: hypothetical protein ACWYKR_005562 [Klebsiella pneumoniae]